MKRIVLLALLTLRYVYAFAYDFEYDGMYFNINSSTDKTCEITYKDNNYNSYSGFVEIPEMVVYNGSFYNVTRVGDKAFSKSSLLTAVLLPSTITFVYSNAFDGCNSLENIFVAAGNDKYYDIDGVLCLYDQYLTYKRALIVFPRGRQGHYAVPDEIGMIDESAFSTSTGLSSIYIPKSVRCLSSYAFENCTSLSAVMGAEGIEEMGYAAFHGCTMLSSIKLSTKLKDVPALAFRYCSMLNNINIPENTVSVGESAFYGCKSLVDVSFPNGLKKIGEYAFSDCSSLTKAVIPNSVTYIGERAFDNCANLTSVVLSNNMKAVCPYVFEGCSHLEDVVITSSITKIGEGAFSNCPRLDSIILPSGVKEIEERAFYSYCSINNINRSISVHSKVPPPITQYTFMIPSLHKMDVHVLKGYKRIYEEAAIWNQFNIIDDLELVFNTISFEKPIVRRAVGSTYQAKIMTAPNAVSDADLIWSSSDTSVLYVDKTTGLSLTRKEGIAYLNVALKSNPDVHATAVVVVGNPSIKQCSTPTLSFEDGKLCAESATPFSRFEYTIEGVGDLSHPDYFKATVYAIADYYLPSNPATILIPASDLKGLSGDMDSDNQLSLEDVSILQNTILEKDPCEIDGYSFVDLGLPSGTLWATCNIGASTPEERGDYFAWGETTPKSIYNQSSYTIYWTWGYGEENIDEKQYTLRPADDVANTLLGHNCQIPTVAQMVELWYGETTKQYVQRNGIPGYLVTSKTNGNSIFLPTAGAMNETVLEDSNIFGLYWTNSVIIDDKSNAYIMKFDKNGFNSGKMPRYIGLPVRPVQTPFK